MKARTLCRLLALPTLLSACSGEGDAYEPARLGIAAYDSDGRYAVVSCEPLPALQGSKRFVRYAIDGDAFFVVVTAEPARVTVRFEVDGVALGKTITVPRGALNREYVEPVQLLLSNGDRYTVELSSECPE